MGKARKTTQSRSHRIRHAAFYKNIRKEKEKEIKEEREEEGKIISLLVAEEEEKKEIISSLVEEKEELSGLWASAHEGWEEAREEIKDLNESSDRLVHCLENAIHFVAWENQRRDEACNNRRI